MGTDSQVPLVHRLERRDLLDAVWVEMLQLEALVEENSANEPLGGDAEAALVEGHERNHKPLGGHDTESSPGTFHSTASESGGSWPASTR
jgi:hypothetical protein